MAGLEIRELKKVFEDKKRGDVVVLNGMNLEVGEKEFVSVIGPSGCGKTTFLQLLAGLEKPTSGEILVKRKEVDGPGLDRGIVFQEYALFPWRTVRGNVEFGPKMQGVRKNERHEITQKYIELVGLRGFEDHYPHEISGGMKQRAAIARALANNPDILLMDEPFAAVDAQRREILQQEMLQIWHQTQKTILFITHNIDEAIFLADKVIIMTARPARVKEVVPVELSRPRQRETRVCSEFHELEKYLRELLWEEGRKTCRAGEEEYE